MENVTFYFCNAVIYLYDTIEIYLSNAWLKVVSAEDSFLPSVWTDPNAAGKKEEETQEEGQTGRKTGVDG